MFNLSKAKRNKAKLRLAIDGPSGSGKTYSALLLAYGLTNDWDKIAVIDTERGSANLYTHLCNNSPTGEYNVGELGVPYTPANYLEAIQFCEQNGAEVIIIDSLTHAWTAEGGLLDIHDNEVKKQKTTNTYTAWRDVTPLHRKLVDAMLTSPCHIICTVRSETEYTQEKDGNGKTKVVKVGMKPQFRKGLDYEMTIVFSMDVEHNATVTKSRIDSFPVNDVIVPNIEIGKKLLDWLNTGDDIPNCSDCGKQIEPFGTMSAMQVSLHTQRTYGRTLCSECATKAKKLEYNETTKEKQEKVEIPDVLKED